MKINKIEIEFPFNVKISAHDHDALMYLVGYLMKTPIISAESAGNRVCNILEIHTQHVITLMSHHQQHVVEIVRRICNDNCPSGYVMWPSGQGQKPIDPDRGVWEEATFQIDVCCREAHKGEKQ